MLSLLFKKTCYSIYVHGIERGGIRFTLPFTSVRRPAGFVSSLSIGPRCAESYLPTLNDLKSCSNSKILISKQVAKFLIFLYILFLAVFYNDS